MEPPNQPADYNDKFNNISGSLGFVKPDAKYDDSGINYFFPDEL
jgi:hypothetical protein